MLLVSSRVPRRHPGPAAGLTRVCCALRQLRHAHHHLPQRQLAQPRLPSWPRSVAGLLLLGAAGCCLLAVLSMLRLLCWRQQAHRAGRHEHLVGLSGLGC